MEAPSATPGTLSRTSDNLKVQAAAQPETTPLELTMATLRTGQCSFSYNGRPLVGLSRFLNSSAHSFAVLTSWSLVQPTFFFRSSFRLDLSVSFPFRSANRTSSIANMVHQAGIVLALALAASACVASTAVQPWGQCALLKEELSESTH